MAAATGFGNDGTEAHYIIYDLSADLADSVKDSADPYGVFELGAHTVKTDVAKNAGSNPVWTDQYRLRRHHGNEFAELKVAVYAKRTLLPDGLIGRGEVPLADLVGNPKHVRLLNKKGEDMGELLFQVREEGTGGGSGIGAGMGAGVGTAAASGMGVDETTRTTTTTTTETMAEDVCDRQTFTTVEDRPIIKERKIYTKEHHPYEKEYAVETKFVGEQYLGAGNTEALGVEQRIVEQAEPAPPCADAPAIGKQALAGAQNNPSY